MTLALECAALSKTFTTKMGARRVLDSINISLRAGQILTLLGPSGCGKTTTLRLIAGFEPPDSGKIAIAGRVVADGDRIFIPAEARRVGVVFQEYALFPHLSLAENIGFGLARGGKDRAARIDQMLDLIGLRDYAARMPHELSGGQQQRIALARALAPNPDLLLLDEPFSNLDATLRAQLRHEVRYLLKGAGVTGVFVTHDQQEALSLSDEVAVMLDGRIAQVGSPRDIYQCPTSIAVAQLVGQGMYLPGRADGMRAASALGDVELSHAAYGAVTLLIRPEMVTVATDAEGGNARVLEVEFSGADQRLTLALADGSTLQARALGRDVIAIGDRVRATVSEPVWTFPDAALKLMRE
ncbi:MAG: ABC transporter ATP-binding protein [Chloroflexota bacterium]|nr:ABC transporter ATP-binding protein [Chloroflexota bacterium]